MALQKKQGSHHFGSLELSLSERLQALRNLPSFFRLIWECSPSLTAMNAVMRIVRSLIPLGMLFVGKLIIDEVVSLSGSDDPDFQRAGVLVLVELSKIIDPQMGHELRIVDVVRRQVTVTD